MMTREEFDKIKLPAEFIANKDSLEVIVTARNESAVLYTSKEEGDDFWDTHHFIQMFTPKPKKTRMLYQWVLTDKINGEIWIEDFLYDEQGFDGLGERRSEWEGFHRQKIEPGYTNEFVREAE